MSLLVYNSSAGSGKTFTLVREYISLALSDSFSFRHILAVTFTNKAANEMKERVLKGLFYLSDPARFSDENIVRTLLPELAARLNCSPAVISTKAGEALTAILHNYADFAVSTIDSFVNRVVRTFAHDLKLPLEFKVETETENLKLEAVNALMNRVGVDSDLTKIMVHYVEEKFDSEENWKIQANLLNISDELFKEKGIGHLERLNKIPISRFLQIAKMIPEFRKKYENEVRELGAKALAIIENAGIDIASFQGGKTRGIGVFFEKIAGGKNDFTPEKNKTAYDTFENDNWYTAKVDKNQQQAIDSIKAGLTAVFKELVDLDSAKGTNYRLYELIQKTIVQLAVVNELDREMDAIKRDNNMVHISEFNRRVALVVAGEPAPFIYERLGEKYTHYLLDEFQDTSSLQWINLLPLLSESISTGNLNLIVGDGKQAIYRWRNGDVEQFIRLPHLPGSLKGLPNFTELENTLKRAYYREYLDINYRSQPGIVNFNNRFFKFVSGLLGSLGTEIYEGAVQKVPEGKSGGEVHVEFYSDKTKKGSETLQLMRLPLLVSEICTEGKFDLQDIAVLVRTNAQGSLVAQQLLQAGIDVVSSDSLLISTSPEVRLIVATMKWLVTPENKIIQLEICQLLAITGKINNFNFQHSAEILALEGYLGSVLKDNGINLSMQQLKTLSLYDLCEELMRSYSLHAEVNPYLLFFLEFVNNQVAKTGSDLNELLDVWDEVKGKLSLIMPEDIPAVRIYTVHKAKGLEFPVVIYPFVDDSIGVHRNRLWLDINNPDIPDLKVTLGYATDSLRLAGFGDELNEEIEKSNLDMVNMLYVAMTRPVERLYILSWINENKTADLEPGSKLEAQKLLQLFIAGECGWEAGKNDYHFIEAGQVPNHKNKIQTGIISLKKNISEEWQKKIRIAKKAPPVWDIVNRNKGRIWGNIVHETLANIAAEDDLEKGLKKCIQDHELTESDSVLLQNMVGHVLEHPDLKKYYIKGSIVKSEMEILTPSGNSYRPDRVVFSGNEAVIIDYKTGNPSEKHHRQISDYAGLLTEMGYVVKEKLLVYLGEKLSVEQVL